MPKHPEVNNNYGGHESDAWRKEPVLDLYLLSLLKSYPLRQFYGASTVADIFISYRMQDSSILAEELARLLTKVGWSVWYAPKLAVGESLEHAIASEHLQSKCVIGLWSKTADKSDAVKAEFETAKRDGKLLAVVTDDSQIPAAYRDNLSGNLRKFGRISYGPDIPQLIRGVARLAGLPEGKSEVEGLISTMLDLDFGFYSIGNITIPVKCLVGVPKQPFSPADVEIFDTDTKHEDRDSYPKSIRAHYNELLTSVATRFELNLKKIRDNILPRLDRWVQQPEYADDRRGALSLYFSRTSYCQIWATNVGVDVPYFDESLGQQTTIRKSYCSPPYEDLSKSILANNPGVEVVLVSTNPNQTPARQVIIRKRKPNVAGYRGWYQSAASGHLSLGHLNVQGNPCPFATAIAETTQEVSDSLKLCPDDYRLIGILLKEQDLHPSFFGYIETDMLAVDLINDFCRDSYEGKKSALPFEPWPILNHIVQNRWFPLSAMSMISTLLTAYDYRTVADAASRVGIKRVEDFWLEDNKDSDDA